MNNSTPCDRALLNQYIQSDQLSPSVREYLSSWTSLENLVLEDIWSEMDNVWNSLSLDSSLPLDKQDIGGFYAHPVWILNGIFTALDPASRQHREAIARKVIMLGATRIADFGGDFGELARHISKTSSEITVDIVEPYHSTFSKHLVDGQKQTRLVYRLEGEYDCLVAQDVLEHLEDPIKLVYELAQATVEGGYLIFANCFKPVIKCHLPRTFHLRHTFNWVVEPLGLNYYGHVEGAKHAQIFQRKHADCNLEACRKLEYLSRKLDPWLNRICTFICNIKKTVMRNKT